IFEQIANIATARTVLMRVNFRPGQSSSSLRARQERAAFTNHFTPPRPSPRNRKFGAPYVRSDDRLYRHAAVALIKMNHCLANKRAYRGTDQHVRRPMSIVVEARVPD